MPSPRKRRLKRAAGVVLGKGNKITKTQGADKQFIRSLVSLNGAKSRRAGAPFVHGNQPAVGDFEVLSGLIKSTIELDMQATCSLALDNPLAADDDHVTLEDAEGTIVKILAQNPDNPDVLSDGAEILDENGKSLSPRTFLLEVTGVAADDATALAVIINGLDIKIDAKADDAAVHLAQEIAGSAGNKAITVAGDITMAANVTGFGGGCSAKDALHYFAEDAPMGEDPFLGTLTSSHGVMWLENPRHGLNGLVDLSGAADNIAIDPGINDGLEGAHVTGQAADRLHYKIIMKGGAIADAATIDSAGAILNGDHPGFADAAANAVAAAGAIPMMQKVVAGNTSLAIVPAAPGAGNNEKDEDFLPSADSGMIVHWFLERIAAE